VIDILNTPMNAMRPDEFVEIAKILGKRLDDQICVNFNAWSTHYADETTGEHIDTEVWYPAISKHVKFDLWMTANDLIPILEAARVDWRARQEPPVPDAVPDAVPGPEAARTEGA